MHGVSTELGYTCRYRRLMKYCPDLAVTSWDKLYDMHFLKFEQLFVRMLLGSLYLLGMVESGLVQTIINASKLAL